MIHSQMYLAVGRWDFLFVGAIVMVSLSALASTLSSLCESRRKAEGEVRPLRLCIR